MLNLRKSEDSGKEREDGEHDISASSQVPGLSSGTRIVTRANEAQPRLRVPERAFVSVRNVHVLVKLTPIVCYSRGALTRPMVHRPKDRSIPSRPHGPGATGD